MWNEPAVRIIRNVVSARVEELNAQWESMEKGTYASAEALGRLDELISIKWAIIDALDADANKQASS